MAAIGSSNVGFQLLKKSGWKEGTGLGAQEQGRLEPVETRVKNNKRGLGSKEPKPKPKAEDDVENDPQKSKPDMQSKKRAKLAAKRIRKMQEEEKRLQEKEFEMAFFREFWPDNV
ncbi:SURP and G-patch domain-containing protein 1-like protein [Panicum virgatum]|uniref:SURP and G-patch domain-containing protein 1-like protein n=1 Tax=Panicum virgatum TaxID=38727 RepID=UPI0019D605CB|nr:SURP and G-patch domain-containing protein 1-like protein [Panicum virgatum]